MIKLVLFPTLFPTIDHNETKCPSCGVKTNRVPFIQHSINHIFKDKSLKVWFLNISNCFKSQLSTGRNIVYIFTHTLNLSICVRHTIIHHLLYCRLKLCGMSSMLHGSLEVHTWIQRISTDKYFSLEMFSKPVQ